MSGPPLAAAIAVVAAAYLVGSIPVAWLLGRRRNVELRTVGSGNPGTSNLFRNAGVGVALVSGPLQFAQGLVPVLIARAVGGPTTLLAVTAVAAVVGNGWPVWMRFNGQRCIAVATGAAAALDPALLAVLLVFFTAGALLHAIAPAVLAGFAALPGAGAWRGGGIEAVACAALFVAILLRRLEGTRADLRGADRGARRRVVLRHLLLDERPGQVLVGPRERSPAVDGGRP